MSLQKKTHLQFWIFVGSENGIRSQNMHKKPSSQRERDDGPLDSNRHSLRTLPRPPCSLFKSRNIPAKARSIVCVYHDAAHVRRYDSKRLEAGCQMLLAGYVDSVLILPHHLSVWLNCRDEIPIGSLPLIGHGRLYGLWAAQEPVLGRPHHRNMTAQTKSSGC